ncbi:hypothetical protein IFM89_023584 [Coptis chinensis]|uniref:Uncharacterized protein n=1 Tax=Coptis chinensis TaxID=261450 RepID=A0A835LMI8_9MAGN|nr:hypothetical protein IFM89_023584 [Coptis chinensis]
MPQSSPSGSHQPNVSQPSESAGDNTLRSSNGKLPIIVHPDGRDKANPKKNHRRTDSWKYGHKHRDGTVLERAQEYYDKGSRTRGLSSCMSNKQLQTFAIAEELVEQESSSKSKLEDELAEVKSTVGNLLAGQTRMETMMAGILEHEVPNLINRNGSLNPPSRLTSYPNVKILGRKGEHVANGYVKTDSQKCHFRDIMADEKVVYITNVLVGDAPVYDGPQDDILYLRDIAAGGFLIWAGGRLQYED